MFSPNSGPAMSMVNHSPVISQPGNSSGASLLLDSVPGLKHDTGLAVEWSMEEQYKLEEGLVKYVVQNLNLSLLCCLCTSVTSMYSFLL